MCTVCGCGDGETRIEHSHEPSHSHAHDHDHHHHHDHDNVIHYGKGAAGAHAPGMSQSRMVEIEQNILSKNDAYASDNRRRFESQSVLALNLVSSPGAGKTTLLVETLNALKPKYALGVIEGDQETANDADKIRSTGTKAIQVNTGKGCHLDAHMVGHAADHLDLTDGSILFIENVGNLVCPSAFDLGEESKVVLLSVTEGEDKPLKYPDMFAASDLMLVTKTDLAPHVDFDVEVCIENARKVNPSIEVIELSSKSGEGVSKWTEWVSAKSANLTKKKIAALEAQLSEARARLGA